MLYMAFRESLKTTSFNKSKYTKYINSHNIKDKCIFLCLSHIWLKQP